MKDKNYRVVLVSADRGCAAVITQLLKDRENPQISIDRAETGEQGIAYCLEEGRPRPQCAIIDYSLPDIDGVRVLERLKDAAGGVRMPIVMRLDSSGAREQAREALRAGAHEVLARSCLTEDGLFAVMEAASERFEILGRRRRESSALERRTRQLRAIIDTVPDVIMRFDESFKYTYINEAIERVSGLSSGQLLGKTCREAGMPPDLSELWESRLDQTLRLREESVFEFPFDTPRGLRWFQARMIPECGESGDVESILGVTTDVTDRKRTEEALRESERMFRSLAASDCIGIVVGDMHGGLSYVNDEYLRLLGYSREEFEAHPFRWTDITPPEWLEVDRKMISEARDGSSCTPYEKEYIRKDGRRVPVLVGFARLSEHDEKMVAFVLDLTERKRTENALRDADRRKNEFIAMLAHEVRNPLAAISTAVHILKMKGPSQPAPELVWGRDVISRQVKQLTRLIDDLLDVSRITAGKIQLKKTDVDVRDVIHRANESVQPLIASREHELSIAIPDGPLPAFADPARLEQVVTNLLTNAAKFTDCGGKIAVSAEREGGTIVVRVRDNGIGIAPELKPVIFNLFTQIDPAPDRGQGGLGIGLTLVKSLVEMHGGTVDVRSEGVGQGSEFTVCLPSSEGVASEAPRGGATHSRADVPNPAAVRSRVLVVDDNQDVVHGLARLLEAAGHEVKIAREASAALEAAEAFRPEFILTDIGLPGMDGYDLARELRRLPQLRETTLIAVSGYGQAADQIRSRSAGFDHHLLKPVEPSTLLPLLVRPSRNRPHA